MSLANIITACLTSRTFDYCLPFKKSFNEIQISDSLLDEQIRIIDKFSNIKEYKILVDMIAKHFQIKIYFKKYDEIYISLEYGPELFLYENSNSTVFHTNPAKVLSLPAGLNCCLGPTYKYSDFFTYDQVKNFLNNDSFAKSMQNSFVYDGKLDDIEKSAMLGLEVWTSRRSAGKNKFEKLRSTTYSPKKLFYLDNSFKILFLVAKPKLLFRGQLTKLAIKN